MTFTQLVSSTNDPNNSCNITNQILFQGVSTPTIGYSNIIITVQNSIDSSPGGLSLYFSDSSSINPVTDLVYSDTIFSDVSFTKSYIITKNYYYLKYTSPIASDFIITSRLTTTDPPANSVQVFDSSIEAARDAFGKMRVTNPQTLLDLRFPGQSTGSNAFLTNNLQVSFNVTGSGSYNGTYQCANSVCTLNISGIGVVTSQSRNYCVYQPGKSLLIMMSGIIGFSSSESNGCSGSVGYFDDTNGVFFKCEMTGGQNNISVVLRNGGVDSVIPQSSWNIDKMDRSGSSHLLLDFTKAQLFIIDMEWLGVGRVRYGFYAYGNIHYCHQITNINVLSSPYTQNNNLPIRYQVTSTSATNRAQITQICSTVISEGGYNPVGRPFVVNTPLLNVTRTELPFLAIRGGGINYNHQVILPNSLSIVNTGTNDVTNYRLRLYRDNSASAFLGSWSNLDTQSVTQYTTTFTNNNFTPNNSIVVDEDFVVGKSGTSYQDLSNIFSSLLQITANSQNVSDVLVLTLLSLSNSATSYAKLGWNEIY